MILDIEIKFSSHFAREFPLSRDRRFIFPSVNLKAMTRKNTRYDTELQKMKKEIAKRTFDRFN